MLMARYELHSSKFQTMQNRPVHLRRIIQYLIPIEVQTSPNPVTNHEPLRPETGININQRPRRNAAVVGENNRRKNMDVV